MDANRNSPIAVVVCDAGPLIHLDELECIGLLSDFPRVLIPESVWEEVALHRPQALSGAIPTLEKVRCSGPIAADLRALARLFALHRGERDALQVAREQKAAMLLTDDAAARLAAQTLSIEVHGSLGILLRAVRRRQKSTEEVVDLLRRMSARSSLHIRKELLEEIIRQVEEYS